jgi:hypothetical protein
MFGGYRHNWADNELYWVSKCLGALWERPDLSHRHEHFTRTGEAPPEYWKKQVGDQDRRDTQLYIARSWQNFPGHEPLADEAGKNRVYDQGVFDKNYGGFAEMYWVTRYGFAEMRGSPAFRFERAMTALATKGCRKVGVFGAGTHTRALAMAFAQPRVPIACFIDDNPVLQGTWLWNYPVVSVAQAAQMGLDAVVLSSNSMEEQLATKAAPLAAAGIEIVRLYGERGAQPLEAAPALSHA